MSSFRIITFNILADAYAAPRNYTYVQPQSSLNWSNHRSHLLNSILTENPADIILLQEVDHPSSIITTLSSTHTIHYDARPSSRTDGLLTAWNHSRFQLVDLDRIDYDDLAIVTSSNTLDPRLLRHNIATILVLLDRTTSKRILVANTHLYWNPSCEDVKLKQARHLMAACHSVAVRNRLPLKTVPFIIGGDFNSVPNSDVVSYLTTGKIPLPRKLIGFACDDNLYQLTRWLRMLGINTIVFSLHNLLRGSSENRSKQFLKWQKEGRAMITMSRQLVKRRGAPPSHVVVSQKILEVEFQKLVRRFGSEMFTKKDLFFGRCVKCNSLIRPSKYFKHCS